MGGDRRVVANWPTVALTWEEIGFISEETVEG
jgi:hypothetical protein